MEKLIDTYVPVVGEDVISQLRQLAEPLRGLKVVHINSTKAGGGVAEILHRIVPLMTDLGLNASWEIIQGNPAFFSVTKNFHNSLQGNRCAYTEANFSSYAETNAYNADVLRDILQEADLVFVHDPQPAALIQYIPERKGKWIWRCHIDASHPQREVWKFLRNYVVQYEASIFSLADFAQPLPHPVYLIPPSIDPLSEKNMELPPEDVEGARLRFGIDPGKPLILQVSRFDRFKDPIGVIEAYKLAKRFNPALQLVLAGGSADDDPEGAAVLQEVYKEASADPDIFILNLPPDAHRIINGLQRSADIVLQKSLKEGFGLTVTEAMWKSKPVIGGDTGGIRLQIINHMTGFLVNSPEGAALRIRYLLHHHDRLAEMGETARTFVLENYLLTRHLREYLTLMLMITRPNGDRIELS